MQNFEHVEPTYSAYTVSTSFSVELGAPYLFEQYSHTNNTTAMKAIHHIENVMERKDTKESIRLSPGRTGLVTNGFSASSCK